MDADAKIMILELQNDELIAKLASEEEAHRKASSRATAAERQNKALRKKIEYAEAEMALIEQCWNCQDLGKRDICKKCANSAVFEDTGNRLQWRGFPVENRR